LSTCSQCRILKFAQRRRFLSEMMALNLNLLSDAPESVCGARRRLLSGLQNCHLSKLCSSRDQLLAEERASIMLTCTRNQSRSPEWPERVRKSTQREFGNGPKSGNLPERIREWLGVRRQTAGENPRMARSPGKRLG
jgi:hypothetical protein